MRIKNEDEILDVGIRKKIIEEIKGTENLRRKDDHYRRHMIYKDQVKYFVIKQLELQFDQTTIREMEYAFSSLNIEKKIIDKLAKVYANGATRTVMKEDGTKDEAATKTINNLEESLCINQIQKTVNRYLKTHRNVAQYIKPCPYTDENGDSKYEIQIQALAPYLYDVVEQYYDRTKPLVYILSNYQFKGISYSAIDAAREGRTLNSNTVNPQRGDGKDEIIADTPEDENTELHQYIWWSDNYHFTTNAMGEIIAEADGSVQTENPLGQLPFVNYAIDQDNSFWARGGDDLADGTVLINCLISHLNHIAVTQGYGQFWMKGKNLPRSLVVGPTKALIMEYEKDDPVPDAGFINASPNLDGIMRIVEMYVSMLLTTNNLTTTGVSMQLGQSKSFPSGIAMILDKAESMEDIQDQQQIFMDNEQCLFEIISGWIKIYTQEGTLETDLMGQVLPDEFDLSLSFGQSEVYQTETEKLANLTIRKDLGLNTMLDLMKMDQPELTDDQAKEKLLEIAKDKAERMLEAVSNMQAMGAPTNEPNSTPATSPPQSPPNPNKFGAPNDSQGNQGNKPDSVNGTGSIQ